MILSFPMALLIVLFIRGLSKVDNILSLWQILLAGLILALFMLLMSWLEITVLDEEMEIVLGPGIYRKRLRLADITAISPSRIPWYSSGIKKIDGGWLVGVDSPEAVRIDFKNGKCLVLGTEEPEKLMKVIRERLELLSRTD